MSTLIERMIQRTQAPLSSLEPIAPVMYAPTTSGQQPDEAAFAELPSAPAEMTDHGRPTPPRRSSRQNALPGEGQHSASLVPPGPASHGSITPADLQPHSARQDRSAWPSGTEGALDQEAPRGNERRPATPGPPHEDADLHATTTAGQTAPTQPIAATARLRPADLGGNAGAAARPPVAGNAPDEVARGPEITVTIGHIEVRAASAAPARPARTPFRPQVSLADFLKGSSQGSRR